MTRHQLSVKLLNLEDSIAKLTNAIRDNGVITVACDAPYADTKRILSANVQGLINQANRLGILINELF